MELTWRFYKWRYEASFEYKLLLSLAFAALTGLCAQIRIPLPWTPVPITAQTFAVFASAILLGRFGALSQFLYVLIGALGVPWFAGFKGGYEVILGATGGYLLGFILASYLLGNMVDRRIAARYIVTLFPVILFANFAIIHGLGLAWLYFWLLSNGKTVTVIELLWMGCIPFIPGDVFKAFAASAFGRIVTPKKAYNGEVDAGKKYKLI